MRIKINEIKLLTDTTQEITEVANYYLSEGQKCSVTVDTGKGVLYDHTVDSLADLLQFIEEIS